MTGNKSHTEFWTVLAAVNALALLYLVNLLHRAGSSEESLLAFFAFVGIVFLLIVVDAVSAILAGIGSTEF
jgi:hypothetical protein